MQDARLDEAQIRMKTTGELSIKLDMQMALPLWQKMKRN